MARTKIREKYDVTKITPDQYADEMVYWSSQYERQAKLSWDYGSYTPKALRTRSISEVRREYSRLRSIVQKRMKRMGESEFADSAAYLTNVNKYPTLREIKDVGDLYKKLEEISHTVAARSSSVAGQRSIMFDRLQTLHDNGYTFITPQNFKAFGKFMEEYRNTKTDMLYPSGQAVKKFMALSKIVDVNSYAVQNQFAEYLAKMERLDALKKWKEQYTQRTGHTPNAREIYRKVREL